jgi:hypothetical protein
MTQSSDHRAIEIEKENNTALFLAYHRYLHAIGHGFVAVDPAVTQEDRIEFHSLLTGDDGRALFSEQTCIDFLQAVTGLPQDACLPWARSAHAAVPCHQRLSPFSTSSSETITDIIVSLMRKGQS